jgi:hypothetical protein
MKCNGIEFIGLHPLHRWRTRLSLDVECWMLNVGCSDLSRSILMAVRLSNNHLQRSSQHGSLKNQPTFP